MLAVMLTDSPKLRPVEGAAVVAVVDPKPKAGLLAAAPNPENPVEAVPPAVLPKPNPVDADVVVALLPKPKAGLTVAVLAPKPKAGADEVAAAPN